MKYKIEVKKQPDKIEYESKNIRIYINSLGELVIGNHTIKSVYLTRPQAKELAEVLPEFIRKVEEYK